MRKKSDGDVRGACEKKIFGWLLLDSCWEGRRTGDGGRSLVLRGEIDHDSTVTLSQRPRLPMADARSSVILHYSTFLLPP